MNRPVSFDTLPCYCRGEWADAGAGSWPITAIGQSERQIDDCLVCDANRWTEKRIERVRRKMAKKEIRPDRLQLEWISAAEGFRFAKKMTEMESLRQSVTAEEIA